MSSRKRSRIVYDPTGSMFEVNTHDISARTALQNLTETEILRTNDILHELSHQHPLLKQWRGPIQHDKATRDRSTLRVTTRAGEMPNSTALTMQDAFAEQQFKNAMADEGWIWTTVENLEADPVNVSYELGHRHQNTQPGTSQYTSSENEPKFIDMYTKITNHSNPVGERYTSFLNEVSMIKSRLWHIDLQTNYEIPADYKDYPLQTQYLIQTLVPIYRNYDWGAGIGVVKTPTWYLSIPTRINADIRVDYYKNVQYTADIETVAYPTDPSLLDQYFSPMIPFPHEIVSDPPEELEQYKRFKREVVPTVIPKSWKGKEDEFDYYHFKHSKELRDAWTYGMKTPLPKSELDYRVEIPTADEMDTVQANMIMLQDGGHNLVPYVFLPVAIRVNPVNFIQFETDPINPDPFQPTIQIPVHSKPGQWFMVRVNEFLRDTQGEMTTPTTVLFNQHILDLSYFNVQLSNIKINFSQYKPRTGLITEIRFLYAPKEMVQRIENIEQDIDNLYQNQQLIIDEIDVLKGKLDQLETMIQMGQGTELIIDSITGFLPPIADGIVNFALKGSALAIFNFAFDPSAPGEVRAKGPFYTMFWKAKSIAESIIAGQGLGPDGERVATFAGTIFMEILTATGILKNYPVLEMIMKTYLNPVLKTLVGKDTTSYFARAVRILNKIRGGGFLKVNDFIPYMSYYLRPLDMIGPIGQAFYNALRDIGVSFTLYDELTVLPAHGFLTVHMPTALTADDDDDQSNITFIARNYIISVGDFVGNLDVIRIALKMDRKNPSLFGYYRYITHYNEDKKEWEYVNAEHEYEVREFFGEYDKKRALQKDKYFHVNNYRVCVEWDQLEAMCVMYQRYAPHYDLLRHNCQVMSMQMISFCAGSYRPPWFKPAMEREMLEWAFVNGEGRDWEDAYRDAIAEQDAAEEEEEEEEE